MLNKTLTPRLADLSEKDREIVSLKSKIESLEIKIENLEMQLIDLHKVFEYDVQFPIYLNLTEKEAQILHMLRKVSQMSKEVICANLYADRVDHKPEIKIVDVFMCKMRKKLKPYGIEFITLWGVGYCMDEQNKIRLQAFMQENSKIGETV